MRNFTLRIVGLCAVMWFPAAASAQQVPHGQHPSVNSSEHWYPFSCCSGYDCRSVPPSWIKEGPAGYTIVPTGEVIPYASEMVKPSPDGQWHWCSVAGADDGKTICLFVPQKMF